MKRNIIPLISALIALGLAWFVYEKSQSVTVEVTLPALAVDIAEGTLITPEILTTITVDEKVATQLPVFTDQAALVGKIAYTRIFANVPIMTNQTIDSNLKLFDQAKDHYFVSFSLAEIGIDRLPYNFAKGKIDICMSTFSSAVLGQFGNGVPVEEMVKMQVMDTYCPIKFIEAMALTADNMLPTTTMFYDPQNQKYVIGAEPAKIGFWLEKEEDIERLTHILFRSYGTGKAITKLFVVALPTELDGQLEIDPQNLIDSTDPFETYDIPWKPEDIKAEQNQ